MAAKRSFRVGGILTNQLAGQIRMNIEPCFAGWQSKIRNVDSPTELKITSDHPSQKLIQYVVRSRHSIASESLKLSQQAELNRKPHPLLIDDVSDSGLQGFHIDSID